MNIKTEGIFDGLPCYVETKAELKCGDQVISMTRILWKVEESKLSPGMIALWTTGYANTTCHVLSPEKFLEGITSGKYIPKELEQR